MSAKEVPGILFALAHNGLQRSLEKYFAQIIFTQDKHIKGTKQQEESGAKDTKLTWLLDMGSIIT